MRYILAIVFFVFSHVVFCQNPTAHKTFESAENAKPLCDLTLLHDKNYINDVFDPAKGTKDLPCGRGGKLENFLIFPFIANSTSIEINISTEFCNRPQNGLLGLQVAILKNLDDDNCLFIYENIRVIGESNPIIAKSDDFIQGNRYFLLIDGNGGSQCSFNIKVRNLSPSIMPTLDNIAQQRNILNRFEVNRLKVDSIQYCIGVDSFVLDLPAGGLDLSYKWYFDPKPPNYPDTIEMDSVNNIKLFFNEPGIYTLTNVATNKCSEIENKIKIYVGDPPKTIEDFGEINICSDRSQFLADTLKLLDPNKDGFFGWGSDFGVLQEGEIIDSFTNIFNCTITQRMDLTLIPNLPGKDTVVSCGRYMDNNIILDETSSGEILFIPNLLNKNGCDSSVLRKVYIPKMEGNIDVIPCNIKTKSTLIYSNTFSSLPPNSNIVYVWKDSNGNVLTDTDGIDTMLLIDQDGIFTVSAIVSKDDFTCELADIGIFDFIGSDLLPSTAALLSNLSPICPDDSILTVSVSSLLASKFTWILPNGISIQNSNAKGDSVTLKISNQAEGNYLIEVIPENDCGQGGKLQFSIQKYGIPTTKMVLPSVVCQDEGFVISNVRGPEVNWTYLWEVGNAQVSSGDINSLSPIILTYVDVLTDTIKLIAQRAGCALRILDQKIITVTPKIVDFNIACDAQSKSINISWPSQDIRCVSKYFLYKNQVLIDSTSALQYTFQNLTPGELYNFSLMVKNDCGCNDLVRTINCQTLSCQSSKPDLSILQNEYCESKNDSLVRTSVLLPVGFETGKLIYEGIGIDSIGRVNLKFLKTGENKFLVKYQFLDCLNEDSLIVFINPIPVFDLEITQPICRNEREGTYAVNVTNISAFDLLLNNQVSSMSGRIPTGNHNIGVRSSEGCLASQNIVINPNLDVNYEIQMPESIYDVDALEAQILLSDSLLMIYDSIVWRLEGEEICNGKNCKELVRYNLEPGRYKIDFQIYYKGCAIGEGRDLIVKSLSKLSIPNIIKRRSDNGNDRLILSSLSEDVTIDRIQVFNRWGNLLFNVQNVKPDNFEWDLMLGGDALPNDVYVILVEYTNEKGMKLVEKGDFILID